MPINCPVDFLPIDDEHFQEIDSVVMQQAYLCQNELGHLCDEKHYERKLAVRLLSHGLNIVATQVPVEVVFEKFSKTYRLDLVANRMIYELKTVECFTPAHEAQCIHYSILTGATLVKLINFRSPSVKGLLKRASQAALSKESSPAELDRWFPHSKKCENLLQYLQDFVAEFGPSLNRSLYSQLLTHYCGGEFRCIRHIALTSDGIELGKQKFCCHEDEHAFIISTLSRGIDQYELSLRKRLALTSLRSLHWFNLAGGRLTAVTIRNR